METPFRLTFSAILAADLSLPVKTVFDKAFYCSWRSFKCWSKGFDVTFGFPICEIFSGTFFSVFPISKQFISIYLSFDGPTNDSHANVTLVVLHMFFFLQKQESYTSEMKKNYKLAIGQIC